MATIYHRENKILFMIVSIIEMPSMDEWQFQKSFEGCSLITSNIFVKENFLKGKRGKKKQKFWNFFNKKSDQVETINNIFKKKKLQRNQKHLKIRRSRKSETVLYRYTSKASEKWIRRSERRKKKRKKNNDKRNKERGNKEVWTGNTQNDRFTY